MKTFLLPVRERTEPHTNLQGSVLIFKRENQGKVSGDSRRVKEGKNYEGLVSENAVGPVSASWQLSRLGFYVTPEIGSALSFLMITF